MASKLFVGSLPYSLTDDQLKELFAGSGTVVSANVIVDRQTNRSKGFGFVEMSSEDEAKAAIAAVNGKEVDGRSITVGEARPREDRPEGGFGGGGSAPASDAPSEAPAADDAAAAPSDEAPATSDEPSTDAPAAAGDEPKETV